MIGSSVISPTGVWVSALAPPTRLNVVIFESVKSFVNAENAPWFSSGEVITDPFARTMLMVPSVSAGPRTLIFEVAAPTGVFKLPLTTPFCERLKLFAISLTVMLNPNGSSVNGA